MPITVEDARKFHDKNADEMQSANPSGKAQMMQDEDAKKKKRRRMFMIAGVVIAIGIAAHLFFGKKKGSGGSTLNGSESPNIA